LFYLPEAEMRGKQTAKRGRGRGRGGASLASTTSTPQLSMTVETEEDGADLDGAGISQGTKTIRAFFCYKNYRLT